MSIQEQASGITGAFNRFAYLGRAISLIWDATRMLSITGLVLLFFQGLLPAFSVYLTKILVDRLNDAVGNGLVWESVSPVMWPAIGIGAALLLGQVFQGINGWIRSAQAETIEDHIKGKIHQKSSEVDIAFFEHPHLADLLARANSEATRRSTTLLENLGAILKNVVTLIAVAGLLFPYGWWIPLILLLSTLPALWVVWHHNKMQFNWWEETTSKRRLARFYDGVLTVGVYASEVRLFGLGEHFRKAYHVLRSGLRKKRLQLVRNQHIAQLSAGLVALLITIGALIWMSLRAFRGTATLGDIALFYQAFSQGQNLVRSLLNSIGELYADALFIEHLFAFLDYENTLYREEQPVPLPDKLSEGLSFENVSFKYPGSRQFSLRNLNLYVPAGKTVAIVGPNGAGKTTITRLLCRFFDPSEGMITIDGVDLRSFDLEKYQKKCTMMFQDPVRFVATIHEMIWFGDISSDGNREEIIRAAEGSGAHAFIQNMEEGYNTLLGKQFFMGEELSGGEWQRVVLARALYRKAPILILDEPTSFMDSWAETKWLDRFQALFAERTVVLITHRFTTAMRADLIYVLEDGAVLESGSHLELLERNGKYAASWNAQMRSGIAN